LLLRLTGPGEGQDVVKRRVKLSDLVEPAGRPDTGRVLERLTAARLLTVDDESVEVAHEALLREWPRLQAWLDDDRQGRALHMHLSSSAREWDDRERDRGELYRGARLSSALEWEAQHRDELNQLERAFLAASRSVNQRELRRLRVLLAGALLLLLFAATAAVVAMEQRAAARRAAVSEEAQRLGARALAEARLDRSLLLAREGVDLADSPSTRADLLSVLLRSPAALKVLQVPRPFGNFPDELALSDDDTLLVAGNENGVVTFFDTSTMRASGAPYRLPEDLPVTAVAVSPDGALVAVGTTRPVIRLVDASTHQAQATLRLSGSAGGVSRLAFSPDGLTLAVGYEGGRDGSYMVTRFDIRRGTQLEPSVNVSGGVRQFNLIDKLLYAPGGRRLIATDWHGGGIGGKAVVLDAATLKRLETYPMRAVTSVDMTADGRTLAFGKSDGTVAFMSLPNGRLRDAAGHHTQGIWSVEFTPNGRSLVSTSDDKTAIVWDVRTAAARETLAGHSNPVKMEQISSDGETLYTGSADGTVIAWDLGGSRRLGRTLPFSPNYPADIYSTPQPIAAAVSPDGRFLALSPGKGRVGIWDVATLRRVGPAFKGFEERENAPALGAEDLAFSPDGRLLAAGGGAGSPMVVWDVKSGDVVRRFTPPSRPEPHGDGLAFSPDGRTLANGDGGHGVLLWDLRTARATKLPVGRKQYVLSLAYSPDGTRLVTVSNAREGMLWDVASGRRLATFPASAAEGWATSVAFSPDGSLFATGIDDVVTLRDARTGRPSGKPLPITNGYNSVLAFAPRGNVIAVEAGDGVELWSTDTRRVVGGGGLPIALPRGPGRANLRYTPDGDQLVIVDDTGVATIWNITPQAWEARACSVAGRSLTADEWETYLPGRGYSPVCR
jgi:WD40 repeat protein